MSIQAKTLDHHSGVAVRAQASLLAVIKSCPGAIGNTHGRLRATLVARRFLGPALPIRLGHCHFRPADITRFSAHPAGVPRVRRPWRDAPAGAAESGLRSRRHRPYHPLTTWMPQPRRWNSMNAASTPYPTSWRKHRHRRDRTPPPQPPPHSRNPYGTPTNHAQLPHSPWPRPSSAPLLAVINIWAMTHAPASVLARIALNYIDVILQAGPALARIAWPSSAGLVNWGQWPVGRSM